SDQPLAPVISAILHQIGKVYTPFLLANAAALAAGEDRFAMEVDGLPYSQGTFKYQAKCLSELRKRYAGLDSAARQFVDPVLEEHGCLAFLQDN
ncbi:MAG: glutathione S-transferase, partial [Pseudomonadota bacterium]